MIKPTPTIVKYPAMTESDFIELQNHVREVRRCFDWDGIPYHDAESPAENRFNRWVWHSLPMLVKFHNSPAMIELASRLAGKPLKPSYVFLSMYGKEGVCPLHTDRPPCAYTLDLVIDQDAVWPINVDGKPYELEIGDSLFYSGTTQPHFREPMSECSKATKANLAFFHFVPVTYVGVRD